LVETANWWDRAQQWHDSQSEFDAGHDPDSYDCWCCCIGCNPAWPPYEQSNPYWNRAHDAMEEINPPIEEEP
jgi:choline dehydrogenase-like flavoprotein